MTATIFITSYGRSTCLPRRDVPNATSCTIWRPVYTYDFFSAIRVQNAHGPTRHGFFFAKHHVIWKKIVWKQSSFEFALTLRSFVAALRDEALTRGRPGEVLYVKSHQNCVNGAWRRVLCSASANWTGAPSSWPATHLSHPLEPETPAGGGAGLAGLGEHRSVERGGRCGRSATVFVWRLRLRRAARHPNALPPHCRRARAHGSFDRLPSAVLGDHLGRLLGVRRALLVHDLQVRRVAAVLGCGAPRLLFALLLALHPVDLLEQRLELPFISGLGLVAVWRVQRLVRVVLLVRIAVPLQQKHTASLSGEGRVRVWLVMQSAHTALLSSCVEFKLPTVPCSVQVTCFLSN